MTSLRKMKKQGKPFKINIFPCTYCEKKFYSSENLQHHKQNFHTSFVEKYAKYLELKRESLKYQQEQKKGKMEEFKCDFCNASYSQNGNLKRHLITFHESKGIRKCDVCEKTFMKEDQLRTHIKLKHGTKKYPCKTCNINFPSHLDRKFHLQNSHKVPNKNSKKYECQHCKIVFDNKTTLKEHIPKYHQGSGPVEYKEIQNSIQSDQDTFNMEKAIQNNVATVKEEKIEKSSKIICNVCQEELQDENSLLNHTANNHLSETIQYVTSLLKTN